MTKPHPDTNVYLASVYAFEHSKPVKVAVAADTLLDAHSILSARYPNAFDFILSVQSIPLIADDPATASRKAR